MAKWKWTQGSLMGIVEARTEASARRKAEFEAPYNSSHFDIFVVKATEADIQWFRGMGGVE